MKPIPSSIKESFAPFVVWERALIYSKVVCNSLHWLLHISLSSSYMLELTFHHFLVGGHPAIEISHIKLRFITKKKLRPLVFHLNDMFVRETKTGSLNLLGHQRKQTRSLQPLRNCLAWYADIGNRAKLEGYFSNILNVSCRHNNNIILSLWGFIRYTRFGFSICRSWWLITNYNSLHNTLKLLTFIQNFLSQNLTCPIDEGT